MVNKSCFAFLAAGCCLNKSNSRKCCSLILLMFSITTTHQVQADCNNAILRTTPNQAFTINNNGTVTHNTTGLMWTRCLLGQTGSDCSGGAAKTYGLQAALQTADIYSFAGYSDWRLPNKKELVSIVERACFNPAINATVFSNAPASRVWSSSPNQLRLDKYGLDFYFGKITNFIDLDGVYVRLVRDVK